ncbi:hypothetical protein GYMLUDRAFT_62263 [Collybiopsis luxurians FD-317 M1]|uniref:Uncharacterized protein n=1 Tax=Collybiopsis luxurians FD-317 M1 TaxID=944289 RepID=A0A0D0CLG6_9AGAR|nr:hypothetical protein GYMLUDRAFT_62263 [Collybiopsis luxurians FD-317 M1]
MTVTVRPNIDAVGYLKSSSTTSSRAKLHRGLTTPLRASLVPLVFTLFYFSTPHTRRHPVFILNILACCSGICEAALNATLETKQILYPLEPVSEGLLTAVIAFAIVSPVVIDSILLFRVIAFYPIKTTPRRLLISILALPVIVKSGRFVTIVLYLNDFCRTSGRLPSVLLAAESTWFKNSYFMAEWSLQMVDNIYASAFFSYKLWLYQRPESSTDMIRNNSLLMHVRSLFLIALGNFIFPVIMNIACLVLIAQDPSFITGAYVLITNNYVAILGVVFATIWTRKQNWNRGTNNSESSTFDPSPNRKSILSTMHFGTAHAPQTQTSLTDDVSSSWLGGTRGGEKHQDPEP